MYGRSQKLAAEFIGTLSIVFASVGVICADQSLRGASVPGIGPLGVALAYGLAFGAMCIALGPISGGHFNPAVSVGFWAARRLGTFDALAYCVAQLAGAVVAAYLLRSVMPEEIWRAAALGTPDLANGLTRMPGMLIEAWLAFLLTLVMYAGSVHEGIVRHTAIGIAAALTVTAGALIGGPFTGGAMNPARVFGPALASRHWNNHGVYWVGPLAGGVLAAWLYDLCFVRPATHSD